MELLCLGGTETADCVVQVDILLVVIAVVKPYYLSDRCSEAVLRRMVTRANTLIRNDSITDILFRHTVIIQRNT